MCQRCELCHNYFSHKVSSGIKLKGTGAAGNILPDLRKIKNENSLYGALKKSNCLSDSEFSIFSTYKEFECFDLAN